MAGLLDAAAYTQGDVFMREKTTLFAREWLPLCADSQLKKAGAYVSATIGGWPLFAIQDSAGATRGFRNACRHQGMMVLDKRSGQCDALRCRYHGWTYDLDGRLLSAPPLVAPADISAESNRLQSVALEVWGGLVMLSLQERPAPVVAQTRRIAQLVESARAARAAGQAFASIDVACNWKVVVENRLAAAHAKGARIEYQWPLLLLHESAAGLRVEQIMPRSFLRTRLIAYAFRYADRDVVSEDSNAAGENTCMAGEHGSMPEPLQAWIERSRSELEAAQASRATGTSAPLPASVAAFHQRWAAASA
jgi:nitrite reductase/ring-hydroxylating ferredoxin subunit